MRITDEQKKYIINSFSDIFDNAKLYLFGSRVDDKKVGGDLDLFIKLEKEIDKDLLFKKIKRFRKSLYHLPFYKIDIITLQADQKLEQIHKSALNNGILLANSS